MISKLVLKNFKCFVSPPPIHFAPINIFIGPNNSGKSAILQALLLLKQTIELRSDEPALEISGPYFDFGSYKDIVFRNDLKRNFTIGVEVRSKRGRQERSEEWEIQFSARKLGRHIYVRRFVLKTNGLQRLEATADEKGEFTRAKVQFPHQKALTIKGQARIQRVFRRSNFGLFLMDPLQLFSQLGISPKSRALALRSEKARRHFYQLAEEARNLFHSWLTVEFFQKASYIGPLREFPERIYSFTGQQVDSVGHRGQHTLAVLAQYQNLRSKKARTFWSKLERWFSNAALAKEIRLEPVTQRHFEVRVKSPASNLFENLADVGFGNSQVLPLVVETILRPPGTLHILEQPEIHLHPKAQCELGRLLLWIKESNGQAIVETHSFELVTRLRAYIARKTLSRKDVRFYYVSQKDGRATIQELILDKNLAFTNWPRGFFEERYFETLEIMRHTHMKIRHHE